MAVVLRSWVESGGGAAQDHKGSASATPIGSRQDFQEMAVGVRKVHTATPIVAIDLTRPAHGRVGPVLHLTLRDATEDLVEFILGNKKRVVLGLHGGIGLVKVERDVVGSADDEEGPEARRRAEAQDLGQEGRRRLLVATPHDGVVEPYRHHGPATRGRLMAKPAPQRRSSTRWPALL